MKTVSEQIEAARYPVKAIGVEKGSVSKWMGLFVILALGLVPIYRFQSGGFQIADPVIVALIIMGFFVKDVNENVQRYIYLLLPFVAWTILVNSGYYVAYQFPLNLRLIITMVYDFLILWCFANIFYELLEKKGLIYIYVGMLLSIILIFTVPGFSEKEGARFSYSFNNPNQLGLYCLILYSMVILLMQYRIDRNIKNNIYIIFDVSLLLITQYLLWQALSRGALAASMVLNIALARKIFSKKLFVPVALALSLPIIYILLVNPSYVEERLAARSPEKYADTALQKRFEDAVLYPMQNLKGIKILIGTGSNYLGWDEGGLQIKSPFKEMPPEVHNLFGHVLWTYGIIGLLLFIAWIVKVVWESRLLKDGLFVWVAILAFSMSSVVIRFRSNWILIGLLLALLGLKWQSQKEPALSESVGDFQQKHRSEEQFVASPSYDRFPDNSG